MQLRTHVKSHSLNLCSRFSACDWNVTFMACLLHRKVHVCVCVEERAGKGGGEGIMVASVDRRGEAKCLQTHQPYMSPDSPHVACVPAGRQATPHATTLQPIKRPAQHGFPLATGARLNMHGHQLPHWSNQNCSHMLLTVGGCGCDLIKIWTQEDSPSQTHTPLCQLYLDLMKLRHDYIFCCKSVKVLEAIQQRGRTN